MSGNLPVGPWQQVCCDMPRVWKTGPSMFALFSARAACRPCLSPWRTLPGDPYPSPSPHLHTAPDLSHRAAARQRQSRAPVPGHHCFAAGKAQGTSRTSRCAVYIVMAPCGVATSAARVSRRPRRGSFAMTAGQLDASSQLTGWCECSMTWAAQDGARRHRGTKVRQGPWTRACAQRTAREVWRHMCLHIWRGAKGWVPAAGQLQGSCREQWQAASSEAVSYDAHTVHGAAGGQLDLPSQDCHLRPTTRGLPPEAFHARLTIRSLPPKTYLLKPTTRGRHMAPRLQSGMRPCGFQPGSACCTRRRWTPTPGKGHHVALEWCWNGAGMNPHLNAVHVVLGHDAVAMHTAALQSHAPHDRSITRTP
eukprot:360332-Chlamydomonas_euryale.AAC.2